MFTLLVALAQPAAAIASTQAATSQPASNRPSAGISAMPDPAAMETVVVRGSRLPGSVVTEVAPVQVIGGYELRTYGAGSLAELLAAIAPQVASARGGTGRPLLLLNARRVGDFSEIRDLPPEAIRRIEIFPVEAGLRYGATAGQRVVNIILNPRYRAGLVQGGAGLSASGDRTFGSLLYNRTGIDDTSRHNLSLEIKRDTAVTEADVGLLAGSVRTVLPEQLQLRGAGSYGRALGALGDQGWGSLGFEASSDTSDDVLGLAAATGQTLERDSDADLVKLTGNLEGFFAGWRWSAIALAEAARQHVRLDTAGSTRDTSEAESRSASIDLNASRALFALPAGQATLTLNGTLGQHDYDGVSVRSGARAASGLERLESGLSANLALPLATRRTGSRFGNLTLNLGGGIGSVEGFGDQPSYVAGLTWAPVSDLQISVLATGAETAPGLADLAAPLAATPGALIYDGRTGNSVRATRFTGGTTGLREESRSDHSVSLSWSPQQVEGLTVSAGWLTARTDDPIGRVSVQTDTVEALLPDRFLRASGVLTELDARPMNFDRRETETLRWGLSFTRNFGGPPAFLRMAQERVMAADAANPDAPVQANGLPQGLEPPPGFRPPPGETGGPPPEFINMLRSGARLPGGRWNIAFSHAYKIDDHLTLRSGQRALDLLDGDGIDAHSGARHEVTLEGGVTYHGIGLRADGTWTSSYDLLTGVDALSYDDRLTLNLRAFFLFDLRPELTMMVPLLRGARIGLDVTNLTESEPTARTASGAAALALAGASLEPEGRRVSLTFRKRF